MSIDAPSALVTVGSAPTTIRILRQIANYNIKNPNTTPTTTASFWPERLRAQQKQTWYIINSAVISGI